MKKISANFPFNVNNWPFFYGYFIAICSTMGIIMSIPGQTIGVSVFTDHLIENLHLTRFQISMAYTLGTLLSSFFILHSGKWIDLFGIRNVTFLATLGLGSILFYFSRIDHLSNFFEKTISTIPTIWITFILTFLGFLWLRYFGQGLLALTGRTMLMRWFVDFRGRISSIQGVFVTFTFASSPVLLQKLIDVYGWRGAWIAIAIFLVGVFAPFVFTFYRDTPEDCSLYPDNKAPREHNLVDGKMEENWTLKEAKKTWIFWTFNLGLSFFSMLMTAFTFHIVSIFANAGLDKSTAIGMFFPASFISVATNLIVGWLSDMRLYKDRIHIFLVMLMTALSFVCIGILTLHHSFGLNLLIVAYGFSVGLFALLSNISFPRFFGREHLGEINGYNMSYMIFSSAIGPSLFGWSYAVTNSYYRALWICLVVGLILLCSAAKARRPVKKES